MRVIALHFEDLKTLFYYANHQMATVETSEVSSMMKGIAFRFDDLKTMFIMRKKLEPVQYSKHNSALHSTKE